MGFQSFQLSLEPTPCPSSAESGSLRSCALLKRPQGLVPCLPPHTHGYSTAVLKKVTIVMRRVLRARTFLLKIYLVYFGTLPSCMSI